MRELIRLPACSRDRKYECDSEISQFHPSVVKNPWSWKCFLPSGFLQLGLLVDKTLVQCRMRYKAGDFSTGAVLSITFGAHRVETS